MENYYTDNPSLKFHLQNPKMEKIVELKEHCFSQKDLYDIAPVDYEDAIMNYDAVMEIVGEICGTTIADNAESVDQEGATLKDNQVIYAKGTQ
ncbi:MAG: acyl-CoA dehydrogenase, partial [Bacteroidales bacterium]|nr:acyl-CoA dehydrogenase [Bacteroidales bacterium]